MKLAKNMNVSSIAGLVRITTYNECCWVTKSITIWLTKVWRKSGKIKLGDKASLTRCYHTKFNDIFSSSTYKTMTSNGWSCEPMLRVNLIKESSLIKIILKSQSQRGLVWTNTRFTRWSNQSLLAFSFDFRLLKK